MNRQDSFDSYMEAFMKLSFDDKCKEVVEKNKRILSLLVAYAQNNGIDVSLVKSREINDLKKDNPTKEDYIEALMVYGQDIEELYGQILINR